MSEVKPMSAILSPDLMLESIYDLSPAFLTERGICLLLMDLDNTLARYSDDVPSVSLRNWLDALKKAGVEPFILSNNRGSRPRKFAAALSLDYVGRAGKPSVKKLRAVLRKKELSANQAAIIGDQLYTDILCGNRAGVFAIAVRPIDIKNPFRALRYALELPFRRAYGRKTRKKA